MTSSHSVNDRRRKPRFDGSRIAVALRPRGRLGAIPAQALDFNRHGIAVHTATPLEKDRQVYLSLRCEDVRLDNLVGVVHNCVRQGNQYRCGIRFRPGSDLQQDKRLVEAVLAGLEEALLILEQQVDT
jgi:hypothetical protein